MVELVYINMDQSGITGNLSHDQGVASTFTPWLGGVGPVFLPAVWRNVFIQEVGPAIQAVVAHAHPCRAVAKVSKLTYQIRDISLSRVPNQVLFAVPPKYHKVIFLQPVVWPSDADLMA